MPDRLDRVAIATSRGTIETPSSSRDALLQQITLEDTAQTIRFAFVAVGASRPVELKLDEVALLVQAIGRWMRKVGGPYHRFWDAAAETLTAPWHLRGRRRTNLKATIALALSFDTHRTLTQDQALPDEQAIELITRLAKSAASTNHT